MSKWIAISERLPEIGQRFDAWTEHRERLANCGAYVGSWDDDFRRESMLLKGITHWMPLPEPPEAEE